jgi:hypothetical protein
MNTLTFILIDVKSRRIGGATQPLGLLSSLNRLSIRREIPLHQAGRWGFETTSNLFDERSDLTCPPTGIGFE